MKKLVCLFLAFTLFSGCNKKVYLTKTHTVYDTTSVVIHDRVVDTFIDKDTFSQTIRIDCDSQFRPHISGSGIIYGKRGSIHSNLEDNRLHINANCNELQIAIRVRDSMILRMKTENTEVREKVVVEHNFWYYLKLIGLHLAYVIMYTILYEIARPLLKKIIPIL